MISVNLRDNHFFYKIKKRKKGGNGYGYLK